VPDAGRDRDERSRLWAAAPHGQSQHAVPGSGIARAQADAVGEATRVGVQARIHAFGVVAAHRAHRPAERCLARQQKARNEVVNRFLVSRTWTGRARWRISMGHVGQVYINLKGREPQGIVEPGDYLAVRQRVVDVLKAWATARVRLYR